MKSFKEHLSESTVNTVIGMSEKQFDELLDTLSIEEMTEIEEGIEYQLLEEQMPHRINLLKSKRRSRINNVLLKQNQILNKQSLKKLKKKLSLKES